MLHPTTALSPATIAALVDPVATSIAFDVWLLARCLRPYVLIRRPSAPLRYLLQVLRADAPLHLGEELLAELIPAGRGAARVFRYERSELRLPFLPSGDRAWPVGARDLKRKVDLRVLLLARRGRRLEDAADAVGLDVRAFSNRLDLAERYAREGERAR
jgi:hypothetical protein